MRVVTGVNHQLQSTLKFTNENFVAQVNPAEALTSCDFGISGLCRVPGMESAARPGSRRPGLAGPQRAGAPPGKHHKVWPQEAAVTVPARDSDPLGAGVQWAADSLHDPEPCASGRPAFNFFGPWLIMIPGFRVSRSASTVTHSRLRQRDK